MERELKIWLDDKAAALAQLKTRDAKYIGPVDSVHTYFNSPANLSLKLVDTDGKTRIHKLKLVGNQFEFISREEVADRQRSLQELTERYGVKNVVTMHADYYQTGDYKIGLYDVKSEAEDIGQFLILVGENPTLEKLKEWVSVDSPRIVTESFADL